MSCDDRNQSGWRGSVTIKHILTPLQNRRLARDRRIVRRLYEGLGRLGETDRPTDELI